MIANFKFETLHIIIIIIENQTSFDFFIFYIVMSRYSRIISFFIFSNCEKNIRRKNFFFQIIIKIFKIIAHSNTLLNNQRYIYSKKFHNIVIKTRRVYQNLIRCVMKFKIVFFNTTILTFKNEFTKNFHDKKNFQNKKNFHNYNKKDFYNEKIFHNYNEKNFFNREIEQSLTKMLFETTNINFDFVFDFSLIIFNFHSTRFTIKKRTRQFQHNKFQFFFEFV